MLATCASSCLSVLLGMDNVLGSHCYFGPFPARFWDASAVAEGTTASLLFDLLLQLLNLVAHDLRGPV